MKLKLLATSIAALTFATTSANAEVKVSTKGGNLKVTSGESSIQFGGRIQYDYNRAEENGVVDEDNFDVRRARVDIKGNVNNDWAYKIDYNLDDSEFEDLYIQYKGWGKAAKVTIGNHRQHFGLNDQTSSKDISILERAALSELFAPGRSEGVSLSGQLDGNITYAVGAFFEDVDENDDGEEIGFSGRVTWAPVKTDTSVVHLGFAYVNQNDVDGFEGDDNDDEVELEEAFGFEAAYVGGPFHAQFEYADGTVFDDGDEFDVDGFYVQAGYIITGETRPYKGGRFKRVKPGSKSGAWEVVARYEDGNGDFGDIELGDQIGDDEASSYTLGVNYYANNFIRIGASYSDGDEDNGSDDGNEFRVRFQVAF